MTSQTSQIFESYVPVYDAVPEKWEDAREFLVEHLKKISNAVNIREIGWFLDEELLSGKSFIPSPSIPGNNPSNFRSILRKVIDFGPLPNAGLKSVPHGITVDANFTLISLWAAATKPTVVYVSIQIPFSSPVLNENIKITIDATNINITTAIDYSAYTRVFVTVEYIQEL